MAKIVEFQGKRYQAVEPPETNEGKKTDCCGACAFRTLNWERSDLEGCSNSTVEFQLKNNPWCYFNGQALESKASANGLDCRLNGERIHWKEL